VSVATELERLMSVDFKHTIEIARPADHVFELLANPEQNPRWQAGMASCQITSEGTFGVGSTYAQQAHFMWKQIDTQFQVTDFQAGRSVSIESTVSTFPIQVTRSVEPLGEDRCSVTAHIRGQPTGLLKLFSPMVASSVRKDYAKLKTMLEAGEI
jgi:carbon monoxide dehydrogenase subunit G